MIISRTPFRISFLGGGTDYPSWYRQHGGSVLATTIDKYCYLTCRYLPPFFEHRYRIVYSKIETTSRVEDIGHPSVRETLMHLGVTRGNLPVGRRVPGPRENHDRTSAHKGCRHVSAGHGGCRRGSAHGLRSRAQVRNPAGVAGHDIVFELMLINLYPVGQVGQVSVNRPSTRRSMTRWHGTQPSNRLPASLLARDLRERFPLSEGRSPGCPASQAA